MPRKQVKRAQKQKQRQSQRVVVNIDNSRKTVRRNPDARQPQQRQKTQVVPQIVPIPNPMMQQPQYPVPPRPPQPQFNTPVVNVPNQAFETNFRNLTEQVSNLSNRFNEYGQAFMNLMKEDVPKEATKVTMEEYVPEVKLPATPASPIIYSEGTYTVTTPKQTVNEPSDALTIRVPNQTPIIRGTLFNSPMLNLDNSQFTRPKVITVSSSIFQKPLLIEEVKPPSEQFAEQEEEADKKAVAEEVTTVRKPRTKQDIERENKRQLTEQIDKTATEINKLRNDLANGSTNYSGLSQKEKQLINKTIDLEIQKRGLNINEYNQLVEQLKNGTIIEVDSKLRKTLNKYINASEIIKKAPNMGNVKDPALALQYLQNSGVDELISRKTRVLTPLKPAVERKTNIKTISDISSSNTDSIGYKNKVTYEI